jgi:hypothetical protein
LPQPADPQTSVGRPLGNPPPVISSSPCIPVGDFPKSILNAFISSFLATISHSFLFQKGFFREAIIIFS